MLMTLLTDLRFHELLLGIDAELAAKAREHGCPVCGGVLHSARYPRKAHGRPESVRRRLGPEHDRRFSFCCAIDGCRGRETPASLRFLGRRVHVGAIVVLIAILRHGVTAAWMQRLSEVGPDERQRRSTGGIGRGRTSGTSPIGAVEPTLQRQRTIASIPGSIPVLIAIQKRDTSFFVAVDLAQSYQSLKRNIAVSSRPHHSDASV